MWYLPHSRLAVFSPTWSKTRLVERKDRQVSILQTRSIRADHRSFRTGPPRIRFLTSAHTRFRKPAEKLQHPLFRHRPDLPVKEDRRSLRTELRQSFPGCSECDTTNRLTDDIPRRQF